MEARRAPALLRGGSAVRSLVFFVPLLAYLVPLLGVPIDADEATYAVVARDWLEGGLPYRDVFDHKPPVVYLWYALSFVVFGEHPYAPRFLAAVLLCGASASLFVVARAMFDQRRAYILTALFGLSLGAVALRFNANTSIFALLPALASLALLVSPRRRSSTALMLAAGALAGLAVWTRPPVFPAVAAVGFWLLAEGWRTRSFRGSVAYIAGGLLTVPLVLVPFVTEHALEDLWYAVVLYQQLYFDDPEASRVRSLMYVGLVGIALAPIVLGAILGLMRTPRDRLAQGPSPLVLCWTAGMLVGQVMTGRYLVHYAVLLLPSLVLISGFVLDSVSARRGRLRHLLAAALVVAVITNWLGFERLRAADDPARAAIAAGTYIAEITCPADSIWEYGRTTSPYLLADRPSPTRYIYDRPFWLDPDTFDEALADLADRPAVILDSRREEQPRADAGVTSRVGAYYYPAPLASLIASDYRRATELAGGVVYVRQDFERHC